MSISSINYGSSVLGQSVRNINNQLADLSTELSTGVKSQTYAGMGVNEGFAIAARSQLASISAFGDTMTSVNTIINAANTALQSLSTISGQVQNSAATSPQNLTSTGQTIGQQSALSQLSAIVGILNTQVGDRYIFSGNAINTPALASADDILNGTATQAGLKQVIAERKQADLGTNGMGRLVVTGPNNAGVPTTTATQIQVAEDVAGSPFGLKLSSVTSSLTNAAVAGPVGSPPAASVDLTAGNPNPGDQITFNFKLPDGTSESVQLTASSATPLPAGSFAIGATPAATTTNLNAALNTAISTLANTSLVAASAVTAGDNFFSTATQPPLRVSGTPLGSATSLVNGSANTVAWYTGNSGPGSARSTATIRIDQAQTVQFGAQANEDAIRRSLQSIAVYAAVTASPTGTNSAAQIGALSDRTATNLTPQAGQQKFSDIQTDFADAQSTMKDAQARQTQSKTALQNMIDNTENISQAEVASQILALQNALQASYQTTSMLSQLSLTKYLPVG
jgi:flagellar hook-associated protein 3 FlgL